MIEYVRNKGKTMIKEAVSTDKRASSKD